ncbi:MAG TPA: hypothetical protein ENI65_08245 [Gammaproteobacteria bacterium]|nr:hypothetical protein [Gammaproteobacteria bacterium]
MSKSDAEEKEILEAFEAGKLIKSKNPKRQIKQHMEAAGATFKKDARREITSGKNIDGVWL